MLSTDHRAATALMSRRYPPARHHELISAVKEARQVASLKDVEFPPVRAVAAESVTARIRALLTRRGVAGT